MGKRNNKIRSRRKGRSRKVVKKKSRKKSRGKSSKRRKSRSSRINKKSRRRKNKFRAGGDTTFLKERDFAKAATAKAKAKDLVKHALNVGIYNTAAEIEAAKAEKKKHTPYIPSAETKALAKLDKCNKPNNISQASCTEYKNVYKKLALACNPDHNQGTEKVKTRSGNIMANLNIKREEKEKKCQTETTSLVIYKPKSPAKPTSSAKPKTKPSPKPDKPDKPDKPSKPNSSTPTAAQVGARVDIADAGKSTWEQSWEQSEEFTKATHGAARDMGKAVGAGVKGWWHAIEGFMKGAGILAETMSTVIEKIVDFDFTPESQRKLNYAQEQNRRQQQLETHQRKATAITEFHDRQKAQEQHERDRQQAYETHQQERKEKREDDKRARKEKREEHQRARKDKLEDAKLDLKKERLLKKEEAKADKKRKDQEEKDDTKREKKEETLHKRNLELTKASGGMRMHNIDFNRRDRPKHRRLPH